MKLLGSLSLEVLKSLLLIHLNNLKLLIHLKLKLNLKLMKVLRSLLLSHLKLM